MISAFRCLVDRIIRTNIAGPVLMVATEPRSRGLYLRPHGAGVLPPLGRILDDDGMIRTPGETRPSGGRAYALLVFTSARGRLLDLLRAEPFGGAQLAYQIRQVHGRLLEPLDPSR